MKTIKKVLCCLFGNSKIFIISLALLYCIIGSVYYYSLLQNQVVPIHSEDAAMVMQLWFKDKISSNIEIVRYTEIGWLIYRIIVFLGGYGENTINAWFAILLFIRCLIAMLLTVDFSKKWSSFLAINLIAFFCFLQDNSGSRAIEISKFHAQPTIIFLFILFLVKLRDKSKFCYTVSILAVLIIGILQSDVSLLIILLLPTFMMLGIDVMKKYRNSELYVLFIGIAFAVYRLINIVFIRINGKEIDFLPKYGSAFAYTASIEKMFDSFLVFIKSILMMFNADITDGKYIGSFSTQLLFVRFFLFCILFVLCIKEIISILNHNENNRIFSSLALGMMSVGAFFIACGMNYSLAGRYCNIILFGMPILACRYILEKTSLEDIITKKSILSRIVIAFCIPISFFAIFAQKVELKRSWLAVDCIVEALEENNLCYGIGQYWTSVISNVISGYNISIQTVENIDDNSEHFNEYMVIDPAFYDKARQYNFIISDKYNIYKQGEYFKVYGEYITSRYGNPETIIQASDYSDIYVYDYDIRTIPSVFEDIIIPASGEYVLPQLNDNIGSYSLDIVVESNTKVDDLVVNIEGAKNTSWNYNDGHFCIEYDVDATNENGICVTINNTSLTGIIIKKITHKVIRGAIDICISGNSVSNHNCLILDSNMKADPIELDEGEYKLVVYGENLNKFEITCDKGVTIELLDSADRRKVYLIRVNNNGFYSFYLNSDEKVVVSNLSIESY